MKKILILLVSLSSLVLAACSDNTPTTGHNPTEPETSTGVSGRWYNTNQVAEGKQLFQQYCAECHGAFAQGNPNWRQPKDDGRYLPPPLNGTGHAWHHPLGQLRDVITNGRGPDVPSDMPAWKEKLSPQQIDALIAWFQSRWPDEIYQAWSRPKH